MCVTMITNCVVSSRWRNDNKEELHMKKAWTTRQVTLLGLLSALVIILSVTPLGYLRIGMLSITLNMIPVGVAAIVLGPLGGAVTGAIFGLTSFASAMTGGSPLLVILWPIFWKRSVFLSAVAMAPLLVWRCSTMPLKRAA